MQEQLNRGRAGDPDPACRGCGGIQKSATVAFGESLDPEVLRQATEATADCDLLLAIGTSLTVQPAALLCAVGKQFGARCVIVNADPTPFDDMADALVPGSIGEILPEIIARAASRPEP
jgi:NAD-dependent deacetylase